MRSAAGLVADILATMNDTQLYQMDATALLAALRSGQTCSVEVVKALIARRHQVDGKVGSFTAQLDEHALREAAQADAARQSGRDSTLPPLLGLPITIKDNIDVTGTDSTLGLRSRTNQPATTDAVTVAELRRAGAVILGKTNVPQLLLVQESDNAVYGVTKNPWHTGRSPGGSSGGEGAAIATGQSPLGIGSDIGGSIRIPAHFCGVAGLKPTVDRWSNRGMQGGIPGQETVRAQMGPLARTVRDLQLVFGALDPLRMSRRDPGVVPLPFPDSTAVSLKGLRIGYFEDDGFLSPAPPLQRAVRVAVAALKDAGATLIPYQPPVPQDIVYVWLSVLAADSGATLRKQLARDPVCAQLKPTMQAGLLPSPARLLMAKILQAKGQHRMARLLQSLGEKPVEELWRLTAQRTAMRHSELDAWNQAELDAVVCPPHVIPAMPLGTSGDLVLTLSYMFRYVMFNFPAGVVPVTRVRDDETSWSGPQPIDDLSKRCASVLAGAAGLPVGVQVVARPYREEVSLAVMAAIEHARRGQTDFPHTPIDPVTRP